MNTGNGFFIRNYLRLRAGWVWNQQNRAFRHGLALQEETITEMLLLRMAKDRSKHDMRVHMFNKPEEGKNGADWEWFIHTSSCSLGLRVQAKRLYRGQDYGGLNLKGQKPRQIDKLISHAKPSNLQPVYVFFNHDRGINSGLLQAGGEPWYRGRSFWGCSIASAHEVKAVGSNKLKDILKDPKPIMVPWHHIIDPDGQCRASRIPTASDKKPLLNIPAPEWVNTLSRIEGIQSDLDEAGSIQSDFEETERISRYLEMYLEENDLAGVAHLDFSHFTVPDDDSERREVI